jgi:hypothetical protein
MFSPSLTACNSLLPVSSSSQFHPPSSHHSNMSMIPELSNSYLTLPPVDQLYTSAAPQQQYSSSAPLGGVPRVAQTSGSGYRYYENMQSMPNWMPQNPSHLEPMDSYVRSLFVVTLSLPNPPVFYPVLSYTRKVSRGDIVRRYPAQSIPLILIVMHHCSPRAILGRPSVSLCCATELYSIIIPVHTYTVRILYLPTLLYTVFKL